MRALPNFAWLKAFEAAARLESFSLAAEELHLTPSAISHQVKNLEHHFGRPLFVRHNRRVNLNALGQTFYRELQPLLDGLAQLCRETQGESGQTNTLTLHCAPSLAVKWLGPRLSEFMHANSQLAIHLRTDAVAPDLRQATDIDCVISYGQAPSPDPYLVVEALAAEPLVPLCSPQLYARLALSQPWYLNLPLIDSTLSPVTWADWFGSKGMAAPLGPRLSFDRGPWQWPPPLINWAWHWKRYGLLKKK
ncbi:LysR family transcriptional regulator [Paenalcaligenes niemegkensis]|uniref:LysR family transcriptional regulator n=1 Tax=Paenalcaligenes niemegkensis TaxID=2895469 RepID=UPI001EE89340|nr:LysR family transcriptional regulator [Paenalcaligenes niemegkensis]MCQ9617457.1 LysR family transcriptional regulator [Paenalcaligenes niemegkensis]